MNVIKARAKGMEGASEVLSESALPTGAPQCQGPMPQSHGIDKATLGKAQRDGKAFLGMLTVSTENIYRFLPSDVDSLKSTPWRDCSYLH